MNFFADEFKLARSQGVGHVDRNQRDLGNPPTSRSTPRNSRQAMRDLVRVFDVRLRLIFKFNHIFAARPRMGEFESVLEPLKYSRLSVWI